MLVVMLIAGVGLLLAGLLTVGFGIQLDLSLGNTLIFAGAIVACTGIVMLGLWTVVRELRVIAGRLGPARSESRAALLSTGLGAPGDQAPDDDQTTAEGAGHGEPAAPPPWHEEVASRDRGRVDAPAAPEPGPAVKPRRNLLFSSSSRKERERVQARTGEPSAPDLPPAAATPAVAESSEAPPASFDDAWPKSERARAVDSPPPRRGGRAPSTFTEANAGAAAPDRYPPAAPAEEQPPVTVLKSGVVDGMAYSLYSDGSIEAQMPEGMMRFASIDELRSHLDQRP
jgi:hypothetical protein